MTLVSQAREAVGPKRPSRLRIQTARSLEDIDRLEGAWREFERSVDDPFVRFNWIRAALSVTSEATPHVVAAMRGNQVAGLAPLVKQRVLGVHRLCLIGVAQLHEPLDFSWSDEKALARLTASLAWSGAPLYLERIPADSPSVKALRHRYWGRAIILTRPQPDNGYIALDESWLSPEHHLRHGRRSDLRRARRKAEQLGPVTTEIHTPDLCDLPTLLDTAFEIEAKSKRDGETSDVAGDAARAVFYRQYAQTACTAGTLRICFLRIGDRVAAAQIAVEQGEAFWLLKTGYDARFSHCSPSLLLMHDTIRYSVEAGLTRYELLGHAEECVESWLLKEHSYVSMWVYPFGIRGLAALAADGITPRWRDWDGKRHAL
jgi:CelD/BcsL family acetyltransferase involved in cellulose biosynthesis